MPPTNNDGEGLIKKLQEIKKSLDSVASNQFPTIYQQDLETPGETAASVLDIIRETGICQIVFENQYEKMVAFQTDVRNILEMSLFLNANISESLAFWCSDIYTPKSEAASGMVCQTLTITLHTRVMKTEGFLKRILYKIIDRLP